MPRRVVKLAPLEVDRQEGSEETGQKSGGAIRSSGRRSARRKSPYGQPAAAKKSAKKGRSAAAAPSPGLSGAMHAMALMASPSPGSVTRARARAYAALSRFNQGPSADLVDGLTVGCGGARGPIERQHEKERRWKEKLSKEKRNWLDSASLSSLDTVALPGLTAWRDQSKAKVKSVSAWRDSIVDGFLGTREDEPGHPTTADGPSEAAAGASEGAPLASPLPADDLGAHMPHLRGAAALRRKVRLAREQNAAQQRAERTLRAREAVFAANSS